MVANALKAVLSSASVVRKPERTLGSSRRDRRALEVTSWEMNNVGKLGSLQDVIENELGACDGL